MRKRILITVLAAGLLAGGATLGVFRGLERRSRSASAASEGDVRIISKGEEVNLRDHLVPGKFTLFDYYADWSPPCRELAPALEALAREHPNLALRKIDIVDWNHPVARQQEVRDLPYVRLYDPEGRLVAEGDPAFGELARRFGLHRPPEMQ